MGDAGPGERSVEIPKFAVVPPDRAARGRIEAMALYAGLSVGAVRAVISAEDVVRELDEDAAELLRETGRVQRR